MGVRVCEEEPFFSRFDHRLTYLYVRQRALRLLLHVHRAEQIPTAHPTATRVLALVRVVVADRRVLVPLRARVEWRPAPAVRLVVGEVAAPTRVEDLERGVAET